jgi:hypothetical protein
VTPLEKKTKALEWKEEFYRNWTSADGLGKWSIEEDQAPYPGQVLSTVKHDNGIYLLGLFMLMLKMHGIFTISDIVWFQEAANRLRKRDEEGNIVWGYFHRRPGFTTMREAHDNYTAISAIAGLASLNPLAEEIALSAHKNGDMINNVDPTAYTIKSVHQGGVVAFYNVMANWHPSILYWVWFLGMNLINCFKFSEKHGSDRLLTILRLETLAQCPHRMSNRPRWIQGTFALVYLTWRIVVKLRWRGSLANVMAAIIRPSHPIRKLAELLPPITREKTYA